MKRYLTSFALFALVACTGCTQGTPGGPGTAETGAEQPTFGQAENTFNLSVPVMSSDLQQGAQAPAAVGIDRAKNFDQDVTLSFADLPAGVTVEPASPVIKAGETEAKFAFQAGDKSPLGDFVVKVTGHPTTGEDAHVDFKLSVTKQESFTVNVPLLSTAIKQGDTITASIGISRGKNFDQDVSISVADLPTGVTLEPATPMIKRGTSETKVAFKAADDASLGDFVIHMTGQPTDGAEASNDFKITVNK